MTNPNTSAETGKPARHSLKKQERLKNQRGFDFLFRKGKMISNGPIQAVFTFDYPEIHMSSGLMVAFTCPKKRFRKAVHRNRIKRLMREAWRIQNGVLKQNLAENKKKLVVWLKFRGTVIPESVLVMQTIQALIHKLEESACKKS